jgi:thiamine kinase
VYLCGRDKVAKVPLVTTPDSWIRFEATYTAAVRAVGAPAPKVLDVVEHEGRLVAIYERIVGPSMWEQVCAKPDRTALFGQLLADIHHQIVGLAVPLTVPRQQDRLLGKIRRAAQVTEPELLGAGNLFSHRPERVQLCHGDLHPANVIMSDRGPVVIDWFDACRGSALADVARTSLLIGAGGATIKSIPHLPNAAATNLVEFHDAYLASMTERLSIDPVELHMWRRVEAAARLAEGLAPGELLAVWRSTSPYLAAS